MRSYILTELERNHLQKYIETSKISDDFYVLLNRIRKNYIVLSNDMELIEMVIKKRKIEN